jgi:hypothetical protein
MITLIFFLISGSGLMVLNNLGTIVQAFNDGIEDREFTLNLVLTFSLCNGGGRILMGITDLFSIRRGYFLLLTSIGMTIVQFICAQWIHTKNGNV